MSEASLFFAIKSVDEEQRLVYGRATQEVLDRQGEVWDYEQSKPLWEEWISETEAASGGKSKGNLRSMHQGNVAAGKVVRVDFNDTEKAIDVCAKVVDDAEWAKVLEGVYTGFSQGGKYVKKWNDPAVKGFGGMPAVRVVIAPKELSLVDRPAVPTANFFEVVKCDGTTETRRFKAQGGEMSEHAAAPAEAGGEAKKGLWEAKGLIGAIQDLKLLHDNIGEAGEIGAELEEQIRELGGLALQYLAEELGEHIGLTVPDGLDIDTVIGAASETDMETDDDGEPLSADKGDYPEYPFRGNQHARGRSAGAHHGASRSAHLASVRAHAKPDASSHRAAANYHKQAAAAHARAGNSKMVAYHKGTAATHAVHASAISGKADTSADAAKAANTGRKAKRLALMDAHKAYMDTYETCSKDGDEDDTGKADLEVDAAKAAPLDVAAIAKEVAEKAVAAYIAASEDAAKAEAPRRPAIRAVSKDEDAGKVEEVFDAAKAAHDATDPVSCFRALRANAGLDSTFHTIHTHH